MSVFRESQEAIAEAGTLKLRTEALKLERDVFVQRALLGLREYRCVDRCAAECALPLQRLTPSSILPPPAAR
jgi:hypothetical protein